MLALSPTMVRAQGTLADQELFALRAVRQVSFIVQLSGPTRPVGSRDIFDIMRVSLHRALPDLAIVDSTDTSGAAWRELSVVQSDQGGAVQLSLHRWVCR